MQEQRSSPRQFALIHSHGKILKKKKKKNTCSKRTKSK